MIAGGAWAALGLWAHAAGGFACALAAVWLWQRREIGRNERTATVAALGITSAWCLLAAATGSEGLLAQLLETARTLAWLWVLYRLFAGDGRHASLRPIRPVLVALAFVELLQPTLLIVPVQFELDAAARSLVFHLSVMFRLMVAVGALVLVHNLYVGAGPAQRPLLRWPTAALAVMWGYDLNLYTVAYLADRISGELAALRGFVALAAALLIAVGASRAVGDLRLRPSRAVAFQSLSLLIIGAYLVVMVGAAQSIAWAGGDFAGLTQIGFVFATSVFALALLPTGRVRGWLKVTVAKHLFQHRYDYRAEWLRFTRTIGRAGDSAPSLQERVVKAVADITDSAAGLLLTPGERGELALSARWQWRTVEVPAEAMPPAATAFFERDGFIVDLDRIRAGRDHQGEGAVVPEWLRADERAWALVPLLHYERLVGVVVLARPPVARELDWEDFDLLRVVGQQLASYLAENAGQEALLDASRFDEFNRRIAFVMHDIKNLASQLALLGRNAEKHADNPAFQADMLVTLRNSADKLNALLARLGRYGASAVDRLGAVAPGPIARAVVARYAGGHPVMLTECQDFHVTGNAESLEQVLAHLIQNAVDASAQGTPVFVRVAAEGLHGVIEVIDSGVGMSADFVRSRLFKPFVSSKPGGFGIGAFEARELVRAMHGRLEVESREGIGSRFVVRLPLAAAADWLRELETPGDDSGRKVA